MTRGPFLVLAGWGAIAVLISPFTSVPFVDDWVYGWSVESLLDQGRLEVLDFSANATYAQALWGTAFCIPFGFSFAALRLSTWVLATIALLGTYRLLREAGATTAGASLGMATLAAFPPFMVLSFSFMTDVPLLAVETWMLVFLARAWRTNSLPSLWLGTVFACGAAAIRVVGLVPVVATSAALLVHGRGWRALVPLTTVPVSAGLLWYHGSHVRHVADLRYIHNSTAQRLDALREHGLALLPAWLPLSLEFVAVGTGLALLPIAVGLATHRARWRVAALTGAASLAVVLAGHLLGGLHYPAFSSEGTWVSDELGAVLTLLPGWQPYAVPVWATVAATLACWASFAVLASAVLPRQRRADAAPVFGSVIAAMTLITAVLWLTTDRYILPFLPPALALVLGRGAAVSAWRSIGVIAVTATIGIVALRDRSAAEHALWSAIDGLREQGVPVSHIDAGYTANGWLQYAHPEWAHRDPAGQVAVPFVNGDATLPWVISAAPLPDAELVREYRFLRTGRSTRSVYVSRRIGGTTAGPAADASSRPRIIATGGGAQ